MKSWLFERIDDLPIRYRIVATMLFLVLLAEASTAFLGFREYPEHMMQNAIEKMSTACNNRIHNIRSDLQTIIVETELFSNLKSVQDILFRSQAPPGNRDASRKTIVGSMRYIKGSTDIHDLFIISPTGDILYTLAGETDMGTNLVTGPYRDSELARTFRRSLDLLQLQISQVAYYEPSREPALFIVTPVIHDGRILGMVAAQLNWDGLSDILTSIIGLGRTGEVVAGVLKAGTAYLSPLRNVPSARFDVKVPLGANLAGPIQKALHGDVGSAYDSDYRNIKVAAAWGYIPELQMGIVVKMDTAELLEPVRNMKITILISTACIMLITGIIGYLLAFSITAPIDSLTRTASAYATGDQDARSGIRSHDEIGLLARAFNLMADNIDRFTQAIHEKNLALTRAGEVLEQKVEE